MHRLPTASVERAPRASTLAGANEILRGLP